MRILWLDPVNRDPQFLNLLAVILHRAGHDLTVRSSAREVFTPPPEIPWSPFSTWKRLPRTLYGNPWGKLRVGATYHLDWWRAVRWAKTQGVRSVLVSSGLVLPRADAWGLRLLRRHGIRPVVLVHKPHWVALDGTTGGGEGARGYYAMAERVLTMTRFVRDLLQDQYDIATDKLATMPHPHFQPLLDAHDINPALHADLRAWAGDDPVLLYASNLTEEHGFDDLLASLPSMAQRIGRLRLLVLAYQPDRDARDKAERAMSAAGMAGYRCLWEPYDYGQLRACLDIAGAVVTPYRWATQSGVVAMAAGAGVPAVTTDVGGLAEMIRSGDNGELVPARDAQALAEASAKVLADRAGYGARTLACCEDLFGIEATERAVVQTLEAAA